MVTDMLELVARSDLTQLDDAGLADRLDKAWQAHELAKKRYGWLYTFYSICWMPRMFTLDPREYWFPSHIRSEIRDITAEIERRIQVRRHAGI